MIRTFLVSTLSIGLSLGAVAAVEDRKDVREWLEAMTTAVRSLNYEGTFVYLHDNQLESMRVIHTVDEGGERERLVSLNGAAREVVRDNASVTCITPDSNSVSVSRRAVGGGFRAVFSMDPESLSHYEFRVMNDTRIAGKPVKVVGILPKDGFRYGYSLYLDRENALPLKTDMLAVNGVPVSQIMFTSLYVNPDLRDHDQATLDGKEHYGWVNQKPLHPINEDEQPDWVFGDMPAGFVLDLHSRRSAGSGGGIMDHFLFSDGLASVSVYVERTGDGIGLRGGSQMGAMNAFGREIEGHQVTVVGAVPSVTVQTIAEAVRPAAER